MDCKSTTGYLFQLAAGRVSWRFNKQTIMELSTSEAKNLALSTAARKFMWLKSLGGDIDFVSNGVICLNGDNHYTTDGKRDSVDRGIETHGDLLSLRTWESG